jgi:hypothetical protein
LPLAGLILTDESAAVPLGQSQPLFSIAGQTLIEYQVRTLRACGAGHIVILVDEVPALLVAAFDRLRGDGVDIDIARNASDAADRIHPDEQLIVLASGVVTLRPVIEELIGKSAPTLLTIADAPENAHFERIDGQDRWAGVALLSGKLLRETAAMLGDWTLGPTLLRCALQSGAARFAHDGRAVLSLVQNETAAQEASRAIAASAILSNEGVIDRFIIAPITNRLTPIALRRHIPVDLMAVLPIVITVTAFTLAVMGWPASAFFTFLMSGVPAKMAQVISDIAARPTPLLQWQERLQPAILCVLLIVIAGQFSAGSADWSAFVLSLWASVSLFSLPKPDQPAIWHADEMIIASEMLIACAFGYPLIGLAAAVLHLVLTQFALRQKSG